MGMRYLHLSKGYEMSFTFSETLDFNPLISYDIIWHNTVLSMGMGIGMAMGMGMDMGMAWHGMAWAWPGMAWPGKGWDGMAWCGVVWRGVVWRDVVLCGVAWRGVTWRGAAWHGIAWHGMAWHGNGMGWDGMGCSSTAQHGTKRYPIFLSTESFHNHMHLWRNTFQNSNVAKDTLFNHNVTFVEVIPHLIQPLVRQRPILPTTLIFQLSISVYDSITPISGE